MQRERESQQSGKKGGWGCPGRKRATLRWDSELLGCKERQVHHDSVGRGILIFLQVLNKDVRIVNFQAPCPTPPQNWETLHLRREFALSKELRWVDRISSTLQSSDKPFFLDLHWHCFFSCESRISKSTRRHCFSFLYPFTASFITRLQFSSANVIWRVSLRRTLCRVVRGNKGKQDTLFSRNACCWEYHTGMM